MTILKELLGLLEGSAIVVPIELRDVIKAFPKFHAKAFAAKWGSENLVWHGMKFFEGGKSGPAYKKSEAAALEFISGGYSAEANMKLVSLPGMETVDDQTRVELSFDVDFSASDRQEVYLGYDPVKDKLYIGFDAWTSEDAFNEAIDGAFEKLTGEAYDSDNAEHYAVFDQCWKEYQNAGYGFWGLVFEITDMSGNFVAEEALPPMPGGFYKGTFKLFKQQHGHVVHLRLD